MTEKVACTTCGALVLPGTAERNGGLCMPCKNGNRQNIEQAKAYYQRERELEKTCPFRALWRELVDKVYRQPGGFEALSEYEKRYYAVNVLVGEVYNGGFEQYFDNSSGEHYRYAEAGLIQLNAVHSLSLLQQAKTQLFGAAAVPADRAKRWEITEQYRDSADTDSLDTEFYKDPDQLTEKLEAFARETGLVQVVR